MGIRVGDSGFAGVLESLSRARESKGRWGFVHAGWGLLGKGGLSADSGRRFRVRWCVRKLVSGPRGQGQMGVSACWVETVGQRGGCVGIQVEESGSFWEPGSLSRGREGKRRWG